MYYKLFKGSDITEFKIKYWILYYSMSNQNTVPIFLFNRWKNSFFRETRTSTGGWGVAFGSLFLHSHAVFIRGEAHPGISAMLDRLGFSRSLAMVYVSGFRMSVCRSRTDHLRLLCHHCQDDLGQWLYIFAHR